MKSNVVNASIPEVCFLTNDSLGDSLKNIYEIGLGFGTVRGMSATLGGVLEDSAMLAIGDSERRSGLYILGKPRMGKSWLLVNLIAQDIENGHGVFFLDPRGDAIDVG